MKEKKSPIQSLKELEIMMHIGNHIIEEMQKAVPNIKIGEPYKGHFLPYILEYVNTFIVPDAQIKDLDEGIKTDLWQEVAYLECFCRWLDEEKGIVPSSNSSSDKSESFNKDLTENQK